MKISIKYFFILIALILILSCSKDSNHKVIGEIITVNDDNYYVLEYAKPVRVLKINITDDTSDETINHNVKKYGTFLAFDVLEDPSLSNVLTANKIYSIHESSELIDEMDLPERLCYGITLGSSKEDHDALIIKINKNYYQWKFGNYNDIEFGDIIVTTCGSSPDGIWASDAVLFKFKAPISDQVKSKFPESDNILFLGLHGRNYVPLYLVESEYCDFSYNYEEEEDWLGEYGFSITESLKCPNKYYAIYDSEIITVFEALEIGIIKHSDLALLDNYK
ncbi:hypothetical protein RI065_05710 [Mycoplasmatota bacterium zrk1]